ncbi:unnamed protein product [Rotaria magnacalcarata]|uniref:Uncharacterized protein n=2 Tax=Rotaria magnacalcarata TaxID=392030 RepID=A0A819TUR1_9BILA|nr:unnamed protein product [Rotaria magnacalcarata]CAF2086727.1 unnamed protein product [Rotaria magnacalcarata]CAF2095937.1 unnamed protein product [Rotaria magnacalcarata]CAF2119142.1 unnamed protein product [Rotaria magnacalcarata]CAF3859970.1 unnamed protein product [Rotaria magnacalcarata]
MSDLEFIRSVLYSKSIDSSNVKPYTGLHFNKGGDLILSTPSLESYRVNKDPIYRYEGIISDRPPKDVDHRIVSYKALENRRYQSLRVKQPVPHYVTRIYEERFGAVISPRIDPSKTVRADKEPGYQLIVEPVANQDQTMISQRFNKLSPFVTETGNNPIPNHLLSETAA